MPTNKELKINKDMLIWGGAAVIAAAGAWYFLGPGREAFEPPAPSFTHNPNPPLMGYDEYRIRQHQYANRNARFRGRKRHWRDDHLFRHEFGRIKNYFRNIS